MTKGERLIWELFLMVRELMPATAENTRRHNEWAVMFHEMEHPVDPVQPVQYVEPEHLPQPSADDHDDDDGGDDDVPHVRAAPRRKRK